MTEFDPRRDLGDFSDKRLKKTIEVLKAISGDRYAADAFTVENSAVILQEEIEFELYNRLHAALVGKEMYNSDESYFNPAYAAEVARDVVAAEERVGRTEIDANIEEN